MAKAMIEGITGATPIELRRQVELRGYNGRMTSRRLEVLLALTVSDLRIRYGRSRWRLVKWLIDPFALVGVYLLLVTFVLRREGQAPGLSLACAVIPFQLVLLGAVNAMGAVGLRASIIRNMAFDRTLIPAAAALTEIVAFGASLILLVTMMVVYRVEPSWAYLWFPAVLLVNVFLALACAYPAALLGLWFPDVRIFAVSVMRVLFFLAPGLVPLAEVSPEARALLPLNPLTGLFESYRAILLYGRAPEAWQLLYPVAVALVLLALFLPLYRADQPHFAKVL